MPTGNEVEVTFCLTDGTKLTRIENIDDITTFLEQHEEYVKIVRCKDCKYRVVNKHYGEKGYLSIKAMCDLDTGDPFSLGRCAEEDDWFCADGERRENENN